MARQEGRLWIVSAMATTQAMTRSTGRIVLGAVPDDRADDGEREHRDDRRTPQSPRPASHRHFQTA